jgi:hypothetical protein
MIVLGIILLRSPGALLMLGAFIPSSFWIAAAAIFAVLVLISIRENRAGRDF